MTDDHVRRYDTFVVRLWRDLVSRRVLRVDVEHVQSGRHAARRWGAESDAPGEALAWIGDQLNPTDDADGEPADAADRERSRLSVGGDDRLA
jgi:hypothetical protein